MTNASPCSDFSRRHLAASSMILMFAVSSMNSLEFAIGVKALARRDRSLLSRYPPRKRR